MIVMNMTKEQKMDRFVDVLAIVACIIALAVAMSSLGGCCTPKPIRIETVRCDTTWEVKHIRDTTSFDYQVKQTVLDTQKVYIYPMLEVIDTTIKVAGSDVRINIKKKNTESVAEVNVNASRNDSSKTVNKVKNTAIYEPYVRPWYEYLVLSASAIIFLTGGFCLGWFLGKKA